MMSWESQSRRQEAAHTLGRNKARLESTSRAVRRLSNLPTSRPSRPTWQFNLIFSTCCIPIRDATEGTPSWRCCASSCRSDTSGNEDHYNPTMDTLLAGLLTLTTLFAAGTSDVAAIRAARAAQNQAIAAGHTERIASFSTDDVTVRSGLGAPVSSRAEYRQKIVSTGLGHFPNPASFEVSDHWPLAFVFGSWTAPRCGASAPESTGARYS